MLRAENLVKRFEDKTALDGLNTEIRRGCIYGLVGPNGSGKTTFVKLLCRFNQTQIPLVDKVRKA